MTSNSGPASATEYDKAGFWSRLCYSFVTPLVRKGVSKPLDHDDLYQVPLHDRADRWVGNVDKEWQKELKSYEEGHSKSPSLWRAFYRANRWEFWECGLLTLVEWSVMIGKPVLLFYFIEWLQGRLTFGDAGSRRDVGLAYGLAAGLGLLTFVQGLLHHRLFYLTMRGGWNMRTAAIGLLHQKMLRLSSVAQHQASTGRIVSVVSNDCQRYDEFAVSLHFLWASPLACFAGLLIMVHYVGWQPGLAGCAATLGVMPIQVWCGRQVGKARRHTTSWTDQRIKVLSEVLSGIASVKAFVWEEPFKAWIAEMREQERSWIRRGQLMKGLTAAFFFFTPSLAAFITFSLYWAQGHVLDLSKVFAVVSLLQVLRETARWTPRSMQNTAEAQVATKRIVELLLLPEVPEMQHGSSAILGTGRGLSAMEADGEVMRIRGDFTWGAVGTQARGQGEEEKHAGAQGSGEAGASSGENGGMEEREGRRRRRGRGRGRGGLREPLLSEGDRTKKPPLADVARLEEGEGGGMRVHVRGVEVGVKKGELVVVCGVVGSGKTTVLDAVLGEAQPVPNSGSGVWLAPGVRVAYCSQRPWIQACTLRQNILFGRADQRHGDRLADADVQDPKRYAEAIEACALSHDLSLLPAGDHTHIGELGVNLSGGQRARVALARAVYADADLYLLDDVLSAVDPRVAKTLFHKCVCGVLRDRGVVLVTHQVQFLPYADRVCLLDASGHMVACEPWATLKDRHPDLSAFVNERHGTPASALVDEKEGEEEEENQVEEERGAKGEQREYMAEEDRVVGGVGRSTYATYLSSGGVGLGLLTFLILVLSQGVLMLGDFWLKIWAGQDDQRRDVYVKGYAIVTAAIVFLGVFSAQVFFLFSRRASSVLHNRALGAVLRAPLSFFHSHPHGRILNKFGKDLDFLDDLLPITMFDFLQCGLLCLGAVVVGCLAIPYLLLLVAPLALLFRTYRREFIVTAREVKRLDSISRSPLYADLSSCLAGLKVIRAFRAGTAVHERFRGLLDRNGRAWFCFLVLSRHLGFRLDMLCSTFVLALSLLSVVLRGRVDNGLIALALTYSLAVCGLVQWATRQSAQVETMLTSVERLAHYTSLPSEGPTQNPDYPRPPAAQWPAKGEVVIRNLSMRYRQDLPFVLQDVSLKIPGGIKLGVVGRTGCGKSSLLSTLLRLTEVVGGDIELDGVSLTRLGLADARAGVGWIPQEPHLFAGTLRFNLDPFRRFSDAALWGALEDVRLRGVVGSLDMPVAEGGGNLSVGQRQLLSLARAVLLNRQVLLMDEATANVDYETDSAIQQTLRQSPAFQGKTLIVIAHRINTVIDSDMIVVLSDGRVVEQGAPQDLLARPDSAFASMVREAQAGGVQ